jgi:hypothetical protein
MRGLSELSARLASATPERAVRPSSVSFAAAFSREGRRGASVPP